MLTILTIMENLFMLLLLISLVFLIIGFFNPNVSLFWYRKERTRKRSLLIYGLSVIAFFVLFGITAPKTLGTSETQINASSTFELSQKQKDSIAQKEVQTRRENTLTSGQLIAAYSKNEVAADKSFKGASFYVTGYVEHVGKDIMDNSYVTLKSNDGIRSVQCFVDDLDALAKIQEDQKITVYGKCDGLMMNVLMKDCKLVDNLPNN